MPVVPTRATPAAVVISHVSGSTTAAQRQQAQVWLERQLATSEKAATQVRLPAGPTQS